MDNKRKTVAKIISEPSLWAEFQRGLVISSLLVGKHGDLAEILLRQNPPPTKEVVKEKECLEKEEGE